MGEIINFAERASDLSRPAAETAAFYFALDCPLSYLVAERVERTLGELDWVPVIGPFDTRSQPVDPARRGAVIGERLAVALALAPGLDLPLVVPEHLPMQSRRASRVAIYANEQDGHDCVRRYSLAIMRLAFCGGFDINDRSVIVDAAAAAGLDTGGALRAMRDPRYDICLDATTRGLGRRAAPAPPVVRVGTRWYGGTDPLLSIPA